MSSKKKSNRIIRSATLRKYASVYKSYVRKSEQSRHSKSPRRQRDTPTRRIEKRGAKKNTRKRVPPVTPDKSISKRKTLNLYQKFVKDESKKEKYTDLPGKERLSAIAIEWKRKRRK